jgi:hypothetical protein
MHAVLIFVLLWCPGMLVLIAGGFYVIPYYLGKLIGQLPEVVVSPLAFLFGYYSLATPGAY